MGITKNSTSSQPLINYLKMDHNICELLILHAVYLNLTCSCFNFKDEYIQIVFQNKEIVGIMGNITLIISIICNMMKPHLNLIDKILLNKISNI